MNTAEVQRRCSDILQFNKLEILRRVRTARRRALRVIHDFSDDQGRRADHERAHRGRTPGGAISRTSKNSGISRQGDGRTVNRSSRTDPPAGQSRVGAVQGAINDAFGRGHTQRETGCDGAARAAEHRSGSVIGVNPREPTGDPLLHPIDFVLIRLADIPVGPDIGAQDTPLLIVSDLRLVQIRRQLVHTREEV